MSNLKMNLKFRGKIIAPSVTKPNRIILNQNIVPDNSKFANIKSVHDKIIEDTLTKKAGARGVGMAMAYACAGKKVHKGNCGCGK
jgi:hypothetical protein